MGHLDIFRRKAKIDPEAFMQRARQKSIAPKGSETNEPDDKMDEILYVLHQVKNAMTVKTGEFEAVTRLFTGQKIFVDTRDVSESPHLMLDGIRERGVTKFFEQIAHDGMVYLDIGANFGYNTLLIGKSLTTSGHLHLFEANPDLIPLLKKTMSVNGLTTKSTVNCVAVTEKSGDTVTLHRYKDLWGGSSLHSKQEMEAYRPVEVEFDKEYKVRTISIDDYAEEHKLKAIDLIKIDVEGVEDRVYAGMQKVVKQPSVHVLLEYTFGAYKDDDKFFSTLQKDFEHVEFVSDHDGSTHPVDSLTALKKIAESEWAMLHLYH